MTLINGRRRRPHKRPHYPNGRVAFKVYMDLKEYEALYEHSLRVSVPMTQCVRRAIRVVLKLEG